MTERQHLDAPPTRRGLDELTEQSPRPIRIPSEAREGLERAWLQILAKRHPGVSWAVVEESDDTIVNDDDQE